MEIKEAVKREEIEKCFPPMFELRPHLAKETFFSVVQKQQDQGYRLAYIETDEGVLAAMGFRILHFLAWGKVLYIDDLTTLPIARKMGLGSKLLDHAKSEGNKAGCSQIHLDTGYTRFHAHRLYLKKGFKLDCHHLYLEL